MNKGKQLIEDYQIKKITRPLKDFWMSFGFAIIITVTAILCFVLGYITADIKVVSLFI